MSVANYNISLYLQVSQQKTLKTIIDKTSKLKLHQKKPITERPPGVEDIDKDDGKNPFLLSAYATDIYEYLRSLEVNYRTVIIFTHELES